MRAKVASDSDTLVEASQRLGHADTAILGPGGAKAIMVENLILKQQLLAVLLVGSGG